MDINLEIYISNITKENNLMDIFLKNVYWNGFLNSTISSNITSNKLLYYKNLKDHHEIITMVENRINNNIKEEILKYFSSYLNTSNNIIIIKKEYLKFIDDNITMICNNTMEELKNDVSFINTLSELNNVISNTCENQLNVQIGKNQYENVILINEFNETSILLKEKYSDDNIKNLHTSIKNKKKQLNKYYILTPLIAIISLCSVVISAII